MRHVCTNCIQEIADGADTKWYNKGQWCLCASAYLANHPEIHDEALHQHMKCPERERWYIIHDDGVISPAWSRRPGMLPGDRIIRVAEEYVAEQSVQVKQTWPS